MQSNNIKRGDVVRFMNAVGGGIVTRVDEYKGMVYVEDQDGFETPMLARECVAVPKVNAETNFPVRDFSNKSAAVSAPIDSTSQMQEAPVRPVEIYETPEGNVLRAHLAFIPTDIKNMQNSSYDCLLINDSNYFLFYNVIIGEKGHRRSAANGLLEPNIQEELITIKNDDLNDWEHIQVQLVAYKKVKDYIPQSPIELNVRIAPVKFFKLHSFTTNDYFDELAMIIDLTGKQSSTMPEIKPEEIRQAMFEKEESTTSPKPHLRNKVVLNAAVIEVDLHINELIDTSVGLNNADMLHLQLDKFHEVIAANKNKKGQKIVFIHGKGEGVLRTEILKQLKTKYSTYYYQDASFKEYGFGATMVVIK